MKKILSAAKQELLFSGGDFEKLEKSMLNKSKMHSSFSEEDCIQASCIARYYYLRGEYTLSELYLPSLEESKRFSDKCQFYVFFTHAQMHYEIFHQLDKSIQLYLETERLGNRCSGESILQMMVAVYWRLGTLMAYKGDVVRAAYYFNCSLGCVAEERSDMAYAIFSLSQVWYYYAHRNYIKSMDIIFDVFFNRGDLSKMEYLKSEYLFALVLNEIEMEDRPLFIYLAKTLEVVKRNLCTIGRGHIYIPYLGILQPEQYYKKIVEKQGRIYPSEGGCPDVKKIIDSCNINPQCENCGCTNIEDLTVDHIIPQSYGGSNNIINLRILCRKCNSSKGNKIMIYDSGAYRHLKERIHVYDI